MVRSSIMSRFQTVKWILLFCFVLSVHVSADPRKIVFLGDSLTAGYQLPVDQAYPVLIGKMLDRNRWETVNAGISGDTTAGGLSRLNWVLRAHPDIVVVALGVNDGLRGTSLWTIQNNLDKMVAKIQDSGASVVIAGMQLPTNYGPSYRKQFARIFAVVAQKYVVGYIPFLLEGVALKPEFNLSDGLHPNAKGHQIIAQTVYTGILPVIKRRELGQR